MAPGAISQHTKTAHWLGRVELTGSLLFFALAPGFQLVLRFPEPMAFVGQSSL
jgi:hypothetical protein